MNLKIILHDLAISAYLGISENIRERLSVQAFIDVY